MSTMTPARNFLPKLFLPCMAIAVLLAVFWAFKSGTASESISAAPVRESGDLHSNAGLALVPQSDPGAVRAQAGEVGHPMLADEASGVDAKIEDGMERRKEVDALRHELEMTLYGRMNAGALLSEAQRIADLDVDLKANPRPTIGGGIRFDFLDLPEGLTAGLEIHRSASYANVLSMKIQCDQEEPAFLEGAYRQPPTLSITVWSDSEGKPSNMAIRTNLEPAYRESLNGGIDINQGTTVCGLMYHLDITEPSKSEMNLLVMKDGLLTDQVVPTNLYGAAWPQMDNVQQFASKLLALQHSLNE